MKTTGILIIASILFACPFVNAQASIQDESFTITINKELIQASLNEAMEELTVAFDELKMMECALNMVESDSPDNNLKTYRFSWASTESTTGPQEQTYEFMGEPIEPMPEEEATPIVKQPIQKKHRALNPGEFMFMGDIYQSIPQEKVNFNITM